MTAFTESASGLVIPEEPRALVMGSPNKLNLADPLIKHLVQTGQMDAGAVEETDEDPLKTASILEDAVDRRQPNVLVVAGGDGTINMLANGILTSENPQVRNIAIYATKYATGGNIWLATHDDPANAQVNLAGQHVVQAHPMLVTILPRAEKPSLTTEADNILEIVKPQTVASLTSATLGALAIIGDRVNTPKHRNSILHAFPGGTKVREYMTAAKAVRQAPSFTIREHGAPAHELLRKVLAVGFINSDPVGTQWGFDTLMTDPVIKRVVASNRYETIKQAANLKRDKLPAEDQTDSFQFTVYTAPHHKIPGVWMELDGDAFWVPDGSDIRVRPSYDRTVNIVSERLFRLSQERQQQTR
jgi:hypothetical protein